MLVAEYRPRALLRVSTAAWASLGVAGTGAYLLSALDAGSRWAFTLVLAASVAAAGPLLVHRRRGEVPVGIPDQSSGRGRPALPVLVGLVGGLLAVRASIEPVTEWDAVIYHVEVPNVATLESNSPVMINDVVVGSVGKMTVSAWHADVEISVKPGVVVPANAVATVGQTSLLGSMHLALNPPLGEKPSGRTPPGAGAPSSRARAAPSRRRGCCP